MYYFFSGKGGVGKTSLAAATALKFSKEGKKVLIISIDPAHSLSDSFETPIGGEIKKVATNLFAVEIDPQMAVEDYQQKLSPHLEKMDALKGFGLDDVFDIAGMTPGIDELAAFDKFLHYMQRKEYDVIIFDTAPTGHTLRFLSLPNVLDSWLGKIIKVRMQLSGVFNLFKKFLPFGNPSSEGSGVEQLEKMKEMIAEARKILSNPKQTHYNIVLIPEEMSILESERSLTVLKDYSIPVHTIIVNQLLPDNRSCDFCSERRTLQLKRMELVRKTFKGYRIIEVYQFSKEVKGEQMLEKLSKSLSTLS